MTDYYLAQMNIAKARDTMDSDTMKGFVDRLDEINALADNSVGFVWRLQTEEGDSTSIQAFNDPDMLVNMSVWEDINSLKNYVYKTVHVELIRDREAWFHKIEESHQVLWWVPQGYTPSVEEGKSKLLHLQENGPSAEAFTFARSAFSAPS